MPLFLENRDASPKAGCPKPSRRFHRWLIAGVLAYWLSLGLAFGQAVANQKKDIQPDADVTAYVDKKFVQRYIATGFQEQPKLDAVKLPPGLAFNSKTGEITGTPEAPGTHQVRISAYEKNATPVIIIYVNFTILPNPQKDRPTVDAPITTTVPPTTTTPPVSTQTDPPVHTPLDTNKTTTPPVSTQTDPPVPTPLDTNKTTHTIPPKTTHTVPPKTTHTDTVTLPKSDHQKLIDKLKEVEADHEKHLKDQQKAFVGWLVAILFLSLAVTFLVMWILTKKKKKALEDTLNSTHTHYGLLHSELEKILVKEGGPIKETDRGKDADLLSRLVVLFQTREDEKSQLSVDLAKSENSYNEMYEKYNAALSRPQPGLTRPLEKTSSNDNRANALEAERNKLLQERNSLNAKIEGIQGELTNKNTELVASEQNLSTARASIDQATSRISALQGEFENKSNELIAKQQEMAQATQALQNAEQELGAAKQRLDAVAGKPVIPTQAVPACFLPDGALGEWGEKVFKETETQPDKLVVRELLSLILSLKVAADSADEESLLGYLREVSKPMYRLLKEEGMDERQRHEVAKLWADSLNAEIGEQFKVGIKLAQQGEPPNQKWMNVSGTGQSVAEVLSWAIVKDKVAVRKADITT